MKGKFIVLEGLDYSGKSFNADELKKITEKEEPGKFVFTREPGGLDISINATIRELIINNEMSPLTEAYLFAANRAEHVSEIKKLLDKGINVICDRYIYSSLYYQGHIRGLGVQKIYDINSFAIEGIEPDIIFYFSVSLEERNKRMKEREIIDRLDKISLQGHHYYNNKKYLELLEDYSVSETIIFPLDTSKCNDDSLAQIMYKMIKKIN